mmetsp:Transcript_47036/g.138944  ORF Transcript_47036/g.138944 Transcript_47036/m.138944 type:complete len:348 (-) Transcript_47036:10-1053(-)
MNCVSATTMGSCAVFRASISWATSWAMSAMTCLQTFSTSSCLLSKRACSRCHSVTVSSCFRLRFSSSILQLPLRWSTACRICRVMSASRFSRIRLSFARSSSILAMCSLTGFKIATLSWMRDARSSSRATRRAALRASRASILGTSAATRLCRLLWWVWKELSRLPRNLVSNLSKTWANSVICASTAALTLSSCASWSLCSASISALCWDRPWAPASNTPAILSTLPASEDSFLACCVGFSSGSQTVRSFDLGSSTFFFMVALFSAGYAAPPADFAGATPTGFRVLASPKEVLSAEPGFRVDIAAAFSTVAAPCVAFGAISAGASRGTRGGRPGKAKGCQAPPPPAP